MQQITRLAPVAILLLVLSACGGSKKDKTAALNDKKAKLEQLKKDKNDLDKKIHDLEDEIAKEDPTASKAAKLVTLETVKQQDFTHYIELQGKIDATNIVYVTPRGNPAQVKALYVKTGDHVTKGQLLARLDDAIMQQQLQGLQTQLAYAENIYNRQKNLWDQGIGTEVQLITAKNNVDNLKKQIGTMNESLSTANVYAPVSGVAEQVNVKVGEIFAGVVGSTPQIMIVNNSELKMITDVPENYVARVKKGDAVEVSVPETGKAPFKSTISVVGASVNPITRSFSTEAILPSDPLLKPNQLAVLRILDYKSPNAIVVPVNVVQSDANGKYVFVAEKNGDKLLAKKKPVEVGESYGSQIEIKNGLAAGDRIVTEGYQTLYEGQNLATSL